MGMPYIGINVSDVEASVSFYRRFGYESVRWINEQTLSLEESAAWGFDQPVRYRGADVAIERGDHHRLRSLQWIEPFDPDPAYPPPINHKGINRLALTVPDVERAVKILEAQGVPFLSEVAPVARVLIQTQVGSFMRSTLTAYSSNSWAISSRGRLRHSLSIVRLWRFGIQSHRSSFLAPGSGRRPLFCSGT